jgi:hypothetical protein
MSSNEILPTTDSNRDPFARVYNDYKTGAASPVRNTGSLHGGREAFNLLVEAKKLGKRQLKNSGNTSVGALVESPDVVENGVRGPTRHATRRLTFKVAGSPDATNVLAHKMEVLAIVERAFKNKEYQSPLTLPRLTDLSGKRLEAQSKEATQSVTPPSHSSAH